MATPPPLDPAVAASESSTTVQTFALRTPRSVRGQGGRVASPQVSLLPVFVAGDENRFVSFVCGQATSPVGATDSAENEPPLADDWGLMSLAPLLLVGPAGCGKTMLAQHLAAGLLDRVPKAAAGEPSGTREPSVWSLTGVDFARQYAWAVEADELLRFRRDIDRVAVLLIDDVHLMASKPASQDELASRIEFRESEGRPTILTSRRLPSQVTGLRPLLVSRMLPGLTIPIRLPGSAARQTLLAEFARRRKLELGRDEIELLDSGLEQDLAARGLDAAVAHLDLHCRMKACGADAHAVRNAIASIEPTSDVSTDRIAKAIARRFKLKLADLKSGTRRQEVVRARSLAMYLTRQLTHASYHTIGKYFGGRDHTTVLHACRKTASLMEEDSDLRLAADEVTEQLKSKG